MLRIFKRELFTLINNNYKFPNKFPNDKILIKISMSIEKLFNNDYESMTKLHRWCNTTSPKYKNSCDWIKKLDNAGRDNCYSNYS